MKTASTVAVLVVLASLSGCARKTKTAPPPQTEAPVLPISKMVHIPDLPGLPPPPLRDVVVATAPPEPPEPVHPRKTSRRKAVQAKGTPAESAPPAEKSDPQPQTTSSNTAEVSPIGQLSSTGEGASSTGKQQIEHAITDTENGLNNIKRTLTGDEQLTSTQIKTFLARARQALADNDLDGAQTLANKAKQLLDELIKK